VNNANLSYADLYSAELGQTDLTSANFFYANLTYAELGNGNLSKANFSYTNLTYARMAFANLLNANFSYANLSYLDMSDPTNLGSADFTNATGCTTVTPNGILSGQSCYNGIEPLVNP